MQTERKKVKIVSDIEGVMSGNNACMSYKMWFDVIKYGCDALYRLYDIVHIVHVLSYL